MGRKVKDAGSAERVIRHHVVKLCLENPDKEVKLPSTRDFAEKFGFTMRTITTELAKLVREGWIIGKHGIGYFTVPKKEYHRFKSQKTVGILYGDTQLLQYDFNQWSFMAQAGMSMASRRMGIYQPNFYSRNSEGFYDELCKFNLDGILAIDVPDFWKDALIRYAASGHPVVTMLKKIGGLPSITVDWTECGKQLGKLANEHKPENDGPILWCDLLGRRIEFYQGFQEACKWKNPYIIPTDMLNFFSVLKEMLMKKQMPSLVFAYSSWFDDILNIYREQGCDPYEKTLFLCDEWVVKKNPEYRGLILSYPHEELGEHAAELMEDMFNGGRARNVKLNMRTEYRN